ncbi:hypothetical protein Dvina_51755 [Dactylosporangium vinaceum]|uniref:Secreted protein n=1 Tax=Dactylosporangium vinaceum TaxID=53362 RepID=A0ABV5M2N2_9ACTN|nr:hypothetical protein [Dactylosporangium vinaceum]UAB96315.1 hypothetical protein Dvina_51755 [Dactylosporangium vinaceum]
MATVVGAVAVVPPVVPAPSTPAASAAARTLAQMRPIPSMCQWAASTLRGTGSASPLLRQPAAAGAGPLAAVSLQLPAGGPVLGGEPVWLRPGRYTYFVVRYLQYDQHPWRNRSTGPWYYPLQQSDVATWQAADGATVRHLTYRWNLDDPHVYRGWSADPAVRRPPPDRTDPLWIAANGWSTDPAELAEQVAMWDPDDRRLTYLLQGIESRYRRLLPTITQHAAALAVLCTTPGLHLDGPAVDQAGRPGIAVSGDHHYDSDSVDRAVLILDPNTWRPQALTVTRSGSTVPWATDRSYLLLDAGYRIVT